MIQPAVPRTTTVVRRAVLSMDAVGGSRSLDNSKSRAGDVKAMEDDIWSYHDVRPEEARVTCYRPFEDSPWLCADDVKLKEEIGGNGDDSY